MNAHQSTRTSTEETMRAQVLIGHGGLDKLQYREDLPVPAPQPDEVLVRVGACGVNNTDVNMRSGWYESATASAMSEDLGLRGSSSAAAASWNQADVVFPRIQGAAVVGRVAAVGAGVSERRVGERVIVDPSVRDPDRPVLAQLASQPAADVHDFTRDAKGVCW
jgi:NADPH:quinone reductase-like Zn-dependent oxidoreductase